jgi:hypothetical protein
MGGEMRSARETGSLYTDRRQYANIQYDINLELQRGSEDPARYKTEKRRRQSMNLY